MMIIGFHTSHEQVRPGDLLGVTVLVEEVGSTLAACSNHSSPWSERKSAWRFARAWPGVAPEATTLPAVLMIGSGPDRRGEWIAEPPAVGFDRVDVLPPLEVTRP